MQASFQAEIPLGHFQPAAVDAATTLASIVGAQLVARGITLVLVTPQTQAIRWRDDGTAPTATVGYPLAVGAELRYTGQGISALQFISQTAGAIINVAVYGATRT
jgi:hypothetical protein